mmetsp:Transcript_104482/g.305006  ORF Transcript_104482/g.305006 Transcript_104482/m.305006 type:complete len:239 (-) Transcript_104482:17-733(-)
MHPTKALGAEVLSCSCAPRPVRASRCTTAMPTPPQVPTPQGRVTPLLMRRLRPPPRPRPPPPSSRSSTTLQLPREAPPSTTPPQGTPSACSAPTSAMPCTAAASSTTAAGAPGKSQRTPSSASSGTSHAWRRTAGRATTFVGSCAWTASGAAWSPCRRPRATAPRCPRPRGRRGSKLLGRGMPVLSRSPAPAAWTAARPCAPAAGALIRARARAPSVRRPVDVEETLPCWVLLNCPDA